MRRSAGILVYKKEKDDIKVLLCHPGGPYWENTHLHSWGIPKGELNADEKVIDAAVREFKEETNLDIVKDDLKFLSSKKVSNNKLIIIFCVEKNFDLSHCKSNTFSLEWPIGSGIINDYPENDKYDWFDIEEAKDLVFDQQVSIIRKLQRNLKNKF